MIRPAADIASDVRRGVPVTRAEIEQLAFHVLMSERTTIRVREILRARPGEHLADAALRVMREPAALVREQASAHPSGSWPSRMLIKLADQIEAMR